MATTNIVAKLFEVIVLTVPGAVLKVVLKILGWVGQKLTRAATELLAVAIFYTGGWALWAIWVAAVWFMWQLNPKIQAILPAAADAWTTGTLFVMAGGLLLWTTRRHRIAARQRRALRELSGNVRGLRRDMVERMATATQDRPVGQVFAPNRRRRAREAEEEEARAARQAARAAEAAQQAEADSQRRDELAALEPDPY